jgi:hypothetical protein
MNSTTKAHYPDYIGYASPNKARPEIATVYTSLGCTCMISIFRTPDGSEFHHPKSKMILGKIPVE